jgi:hypothetical protein
MFMRGTKFQLRTEFFRGVTAAVAPNRKSAAGELAKIVIL